MPIRINLKELISSDSQEIAIDKINFNFNKLLELGIGELGLTGNTGQPGSAGPIGPDGDTGIRGSSWYVDAVVDPNSLEFTDLIAGDFYLSSERISIWRWTGEQWQFVADLSNVVNTYLSESPSPFVRGLGLGSSKDNRFILFSRRGNTQQDIVDDLTLSNASNNDILFLNNFNEETLNGLLLDQVPPGFEYGPALTPTLNQVATTSLFNSLAAIYADHYNGGIFGRYHLELGTLYERDQSNPNEEPILSENKHNLKLRFLKDQLTTPIYPISNNFINIARFNLSKPELSAITEIDQNSVYEFIAPSFNQESGSPQREEITMRLGGALGLGEYSLAGVTAVDGIYLQAGTNHAFSIGISKGFTNSVNETTYSATLTEDIIYFTKSTTPNLNWLFDGKLKVRGQLFVSDSAGFGGGVGIGVAGSAAAPSLTWFDANTTFNKNTGFFKISTNGIGITTAGTERFRIANTGLYASVNGSSTQPVLSWLNDTQTGIYHPAVGTLAISISAIERFKFVSGGRLMIGANYTSTTASQNISAESRDVVSIKGAGDTNTSSQTLPEVNNQITAGTMERQVIGGLLSVSKSSGDTKGISYVGYNASFRRNATTGQYYVHFPEKQDLSSSTLAGGSSAGVFTFMDLDGRFHIATYQDGNQVSTGTVGPTGGSGPS